MSPVGRFGVQPPPLQAFELAPLLSVPVESTVTKWALAAASASIVLALAGFPALAQDLGDPAHGQLLFQQRCGLCHTAGPQDGDGGQGPPLAGVVGRHAGTAPNFGYTAALKASGKIWTPAALDRFLTAPGRYVPGTAMPLSTPSPKDRADLIAYLSTVK